MCARCEYFTTRDIPPEQAEKNRGECVYFLVGVGDYVDWNGNCKKYRPAKQMAPREKFILKMEDQNVRNKDAVD